jgi:hypothetical protein
MADWMAAKSAPRLAVCSVDLSAAVLAAQWAAHSVASTAAMMVDWMVVHAAVPMVDLKAVTSAPRLVVRSADW